MFLSKLAVLSFIATIVSVAYAQEDAVSSAVRAELSKRFPGARIELMDQIHWATEMPHGEIRSIRVNDENAKGQVSFHVQSASEGGVRHSQGWISFAAYLPARMTVRRVLPGERLQPEQFALQEINVASGPTRDLRGVILPQKTDISHLEARQTLVEGQPLLSSAIQKIPDVRRGDAVRVHLVSGGLTLSTQATASEPAYLNGSVRVLTHRTKKELAGKLVSNGVVEVKL